MEPNDYNIESQSNKIYSLEGECLFEGSSSTVYIIESNQTAEDIIDLTQDCGDTEQAVQDIADESNKDDKGTIKVDDHQVNDLKMNKAQLGTEAFFFESSNETAKELVNIEKIIDLTQDLADTDTKLQDIQEFESVLNTFQISGIFLDQVGSTNNEMLSLDEVNEYFGSLVTESGSLDIKAFPSVETNHCSTINSEDILEMNSNITVDDIKLEIQNNDPPTYINLTTVKAEVISKEHFDLDKLYEEERQSLDSDGYHSSDFEFITENEATVNITNFRRKDFSNPGNYFHHKMEGSIDSDSDDDYDSYNNFIPQIYDKFNRRTPDPVAGPSGINRQANMDSKGCSFNFSQDSQSQSIEGHINRNNVLDPGEGPSDLNERIEDERPSDLNESIEDYYNRDYRQNHQIPDEDGYLDLFQGPYGPALPMSDLIFLENKSIRPSAMNTQYAGIGFEDQLLRYQHQPDSSEEEYGDEAKESVDKILSMYPYENRKLRRF